ncbi:MULTISPECIES: hypothetical protein [unclassified Pseudonocardia]|uniref:hypothetical protein n=1 Tax=unclassified Pseudonocardia TaxID=2619320 RepID=UPI00094ABCBB|nr:hypothetical protein [Pseudonocardia sp. Ae707_Ps1]OLM19150.1 hypothetical protein Ae707Ps1_3409 [Pseudonocardia sp. Ae707_Ps1]
MSPVLAPHRPADHRRAAPGIRIVMLLGLPGGRPAWTTRSARITGLLLTLAGVEADGVTLPVPLADRHALRAWARSAEPALLAAAAPEHGSRAVFAVDLDDVDVLAAAGRALADLLRRERAPMLRCGHHAGDPVTGALHREALRQDVAAEQLVAELGRAARLLAPAHLRPRAPEFAGS